MYIENQLITINIYIRNLKITITKNFQWSIHRGISLSQSYNPEAVLSNLIHNPPDNGYIKKVFEVLTTMFNRIE